MRVYIFITLVFLGGCITSPYTMPIPGTENAKMRFVSLPENNIFVNASKIDACVSDLSQPEITALGRKANISRKLNRLNMPLYDSSIPEVQQNEMYIPAGSSFSFQFNGVGFLGTTPSDGELTGAEIYSWCRLLITFTPKAGENYEAIYDYGDNKSGENACNVVLYSIIKNEEGSYTKVELKEYKVTRQYCKNMFK